MYVVPDIVEEILLSLPLKSIFKFKIVSKQWRSILESKRFVERRRRKNVQSRRKTILAAAYGCDCGGNHRQSHPLPNSSRLFKGDDGEEIVYLHCNNAGVSTMSCDGLVCFTGLDWITVTNPSTRQILRFPSSPSSDQVTSRAQNRDDYMLNWVFGFGKDKVTGSFKVVKMVLSEEARCNVLDVESGVWRTLNKLLPPCAVHVVRGKRSVCVDGSVYWSFNGMYRIESGNNKILALDLHKEEFSLVSVPGVTREIEIANLDDRLAIASWTVTPQLTLEIWIMNAEEDEDETWSKAYSIRLDGLDTNRWGLGMWFRPVSVSKQGDIVFCSNSKRLFKYYQTTNEIRCLCLDICVISPYTENLVHFGSSESGNDHPYCGIRSSRRCRLLTRPPGSWFDKKVRYVVREFLIISLSFVCYLLMDSLFRFLKIRDSNDDTNVGSIACLCFYYVLQFWF
ncbi:unnamed protein product [Cochlearia groenlandica]